ncbi:hypothetical protein [Odoribacter lunatus]|uniref:hypothetical protein n=1 Tax=Odoribacter lunatus TaxID=2941335 RepID=UPI00203AA002|nr:hypothetical protein [Odoribacter lunatus]
MKAKKKVVNKKLDRNAACAFLFLADATTYLNRIQTLEKCGEYCYAILNIWNRIESTLKLLNYYKHIKDEYPEQLKHQYLPKEIKEKFKHEIKIIISSDRQCLWKIRNKIVHQNKTMTKEEYEHYYPNAVIILNELTTILPSKQDFQEKLNRTRN